MIDSGLEIFSSEDEVTSDTDVEQFSSSEDWSLEQYYLGKS